VRNLAYSFFHQSDHSQVRETTGSLLNAPDPRLTRWTEQELVRIRIVLRKLTAQRVGNPEDAEDLVQETLLTMVRKAPEVEIEKGMLIWAMGILRKKVGNYYRRAQRLYPFDAESQHAGCIPIVPSPESSLHHTELLAIVDELLSKLTAAERTAIDLYLAGRQTGEIVALLHPERYQNIVNRLHRGRKKLARELARHGYRRPACGKSR
jgi:RNA polymerase sigma-70 factor, ECF subfamily